jgi:hypothetical protein
MQLILSTKVAALAVYALSEIDLGTAIDSRNGAYRTVRGGSSGLRAVRKKGIQRPTR